MFIAGIAIASMMLGYYVGKFVVPKVFEASTVIEWEPPDDTPNPRDERTLRTQLDSLKLPANLAIVRRELSIPQKLDELAERLDMTFNRDSNLVTVTATADDPEKAVELADTSVRVFLEHLRTLDAARLDETVETSKVDVGRARRRLEEAQQAYDAFRQEHSITDLNTEREQAITMAAGLRAEADMARADSQSAWAQQAPVQVMPGSGESAHLQSVRARLDEAKARLSPDHPRVRALTAELAAAKASEVTIRRMTNAQNRSTQAASAAALRAAARERESAYKKVEREARERLARLSEVEGEASSLLASVRVAEGYLADMEAKLAQQNDAARAPSASFRVVNPARMPESPARSMRKPIAIMIPLVLFMLTILTVVGYELRGLRVHTASELAFWGGAPVIGASVWPSDPRPLGALIEELSMMALRSGGKTLIVAADGAEWAADKIAKHIKVNVAPDSVQREDDTQTTYYGIQAEALPAGAENAAGQLAAGQGGAGHLAGADGHAPMALARRTEGSMQRTKGNRLEQVKFSRAEYVMGDDDYPPAEIASFSGGALGDPYLRQASRAADRVIVLVPAGELSVFRARALAGLVGRSDEGIAFFLTHVRPFLSMLPDQCGPVEDFWDAGHFDD